MLTGSLRQRWTWGTDGIAAILNRLVSTLRIDNTDVFFSTEGTQLQDMPDMSQPSPWSAKRRINKAERTIVEAPPHTVRYLNVSHQHLEKMDALSALKDRWKAHVSLYWHDAIPISFPEYAAPNEPARHRQRLVTALTIADQLEVNSRATAEELKTLAEREGLLVPPLSIRPLQTELPAQDDVPDVTVSKPYFVTIGTIEPRKNHLLLLQVWRELATEYGSSCPGLVIIGRRGWMNEGTFAMLDRCDAIAPFVVEAPGLSDHAAATLLKGARALLFPSFAEGFGLPLLEAERMGRPVIASDLNVFREVATKPFQALSPLDGGAWKQAIINAYQS